jgi:hypothetical protein
VHLFESNANVVVVDANSDYDAVDLDKGFFL